MGQSLNPKVRWDLRMWSKFFPHSLQLCPLSFFDHAVLSVKQFWACTPRVNHPAM